MLTKKDSLYKTLSQKKFGSTCILADLIGVKNDMCNYLSIERFRKTLYFADYSFFDIDGKMTGTHLKTTSTSTFSSEEMLARTHSQMNSASFRDFVFECDKEVCNVTV